jgi:hypothetical protein
MLPHLPSANTDQDQSERGCQSGPTASDHLQCNRRVLEGVQTIRQLPKATMGWVEFACLGKCGISFSNGTAFQGSAGAL